MSDYYSGIRSLTENYALINNNELKIIYSKVILKIKENWINNNTNTENDILNLLK